jgi:hypothetical protein
MADDRQSCGQRLRFPAAAACRLMNACAAASDKVISTNIHTVQAGRIKMSHLGRSGFRSNLDSTACMASLATVIPFS